jgi:putative hydrolase of the HAD superfamily
VSIVAEFAAKLHQQRGEEVARELVPLQYPSHEEKLHDVQAVIFDVYGTLVDYRKAEFGDQASKERSLLDAFRAVINYFGLDPYLREINPGMEPERTLSDFYHGLIALEHEKARREDIETPEVRIERVWGVILLMVKRRGYDVGGLGLGDEREVARCMAYYYNFSALERGFYDGVVWALERLKHGNLKLGILSNAQFYTPIDLNLFVRDQSNGRYVDYTEFFDTELIFYSYEYGIAKPGVFMFRKLFDVLYEYHILPSQTVFVGNDLLIDIKPAQDIGMKTALFCGDRCGTFLHDAAGEVMPDITFTSFHDLPELISFHDARKG